MDECILSFTERVISSDDELKFNAIFIHFLEPISSFCRGIESSFLTPSKFSLSSPAPPTLFMYANEYEIGLFLSFIFKTYPNIFESIMDKSNSILKLPGLANYKSDLIARRYFI